MDRLKYFLDILKIQARFYISDPVDAKRGVEIEWIKHHDCVAFLTLPLDLDFILSRDIASRLTRWGRFAPHERRADGRMPQEMDAGEIERIVIMLSSTLDLLAERGALAIANHT